MDEKRRRPPDGSAGCFILALAAATLRPGFWGAFSGLQSGLVVGFILVGLVVLAKWLMETMLKRTDNWMDKVLPLVSMAGICMIIARHHRPLERKLMTVGLALLAAVVLHNGIGYSWPISPRD